MSFNFLAAVTICSDSAAQENKICHCFHFFSIYLPWSDGTRCYDLSFFECWISSQFFHCPLSLSSRDSLLLHFLPLEVVDIFPDNLDSGSCFIQPSISHDVLCISSFQLLSHIHSLQSHGLQHARIPRPSSTPGAYSNLCHWVGDVIQPSPSVVPFSSCFQSSPASGSFPMSQFFTSGGQSIGTLASASVFLMNIQGWFPLGLTGLLSLQSQESSPTPQFKSISSLTFSFLYGPTLTSIHNYW